MSKPPTPPTPRKRSFLRKPLFHFLLLGGVLFLIQPFLQDQRSGAGIPTLVVSASDIESIERDWQSLTGTKPSAQERARLIQQRIDDEVLIEEAIAQGWHLSDPVIHDRLIRNIRFLQPESQESDEELLRQARDMGMDRSDLVVRRRLIERMKMLISSKARNLEFNDQELQQYYQKHAEDYEVPEKIELSQLYLSKDMRGSRLQEDADTLLQNLLTNGTGPKSAMQAGDPFLHPTHFPLSSKKKVAARLGEEFAELAFAQPDHQWTGPIPSSYGLHLVWIHHRAIAYTPSLDEVRSRVLKDVQREKERELLAQVLEEYRKNWLIQIEDSGS